MPSKSAKQAKFMRAIAHSKDFAKKVGVPQSVGKEYSKADERMAKGYKRGGAPKDTTTGTSTTKPMSADAKKQRKEFEDEMMRRNKAGQDKAKQEGKAAPRYAKGGSVSSRADGVAKKGRTNTKMVSMKKGGK